MKLQRPARDKLLDLTVALLKAVSKSLVKIDQKHPMRLLSQGCAEGEGRRCFATPPYWFANMIMRVIVLPCYDAKSVSTRQANPGSSGEVSSPSALTCPTRVNLPVSRRYTATWRAKRSTIQYSATP